MSAQLFFTKLFLAALFWTWLLASCLFAQQPRTPVPAEWEKLVEAAKREGKVTVSIPASAELRKQLEGNFKKRYGIEVESFTARGSAGVRRMVDDGVRRFRATVGIHEVADDVALIPGAEEPVDHGAGAVLLVPHRPVERRDEDGDVGAGR